RPPDGLRVVDGVEPQVRAAVGRARTPPQDRIGRQARPDGAREAPGREEGSLSLDRNDAGQPRVRKGIDVHRVIEELELALTDPKTGDPRLFQRGGELVITRGATAE